MDLGIIREDDIFFIIKLKDFILVCLFLIFSELNKKENKH